MDNSIKVMKTYKAMGGEFHLMCFPQNFHSKSEVNEIFDEAYQEIKRIEDKFTDFRPSLFNKINELAGIKPCHVDDEIFDLVQRSLELSKKTNGLFDLSFASVGHRWRHNKASMKSLSSVERHSLQKLIDYKKIKMNPKDKTIYLPDASMRIGLGGIGKGYAVDSAYKLLRSAGLYNFYINGSGDIRVHSDSRAPRMWKIGIRNPLSKDATKTIGVVQIQNGAVATSGSYVHKVDNFDKKLDHHIINPSTGRSVNEIISSTILGHTCIESDTTATIIMNMKPSVAIEYMNEEDIFGAVIDRNGKSFLSQKALKCFGY